MVEDPVDNLLSKNSVEIMVDRSPWGKDKIVVFRRQLENLLLAIAINSYNAICYVTVNMCKSNDFSLRRLRLKVVGVACETRVDWSIL